MSRLTFDQVTLDVVSSGKEYAVSLDDRQHRVELLGAPDGRLELLIDGRRVSAYVSSEGQRRWVTIGGRTFLLTKSSPSRRTSATHDGSSDLSAPMPGQVRAVNVSAGDHVTKGQVLAVLEAMKMEIRLQAPFEGVVSSVDAKVGQTVEREQVLVKLQQS
ncbi:MAG: DUF2118 domain-containing protein [Anaerolineae bacterium]